MHFGSVLYHHHMFALETSIPQLGNGSVCVRQESLSVGGISPRTRHHSRSIAWADLVLIGFDQLIEGRPIDQPLFDQKRFERLDAQGWIRRNNLVTMVMIVIMLLCMGEIRGYGSS